MSTSPKNPTLLLPPPRICPSPHIPITGVGVAYLEGFLLIRLFSMRDERPIYSTLFAANCLKVGLSGDGCVAFRCLITDRLVLGLFSLGPLIDAGLSAARIPGVWPLGPGSLVFDSLLSDSWAVDPLLLCSSIVARLVKCSFVLTVSLGLVTDFLMFGLPSLDPLIGAGLSDTRISAVRLFGPALSTSGSLVFGNTLPDCLAVSLFLLVSLIVSRSVWGSFMPSSLLLYTSIHAPYTSTSAESPWYISFQQRIPCLREWPKGRQPYRVLRLRSVHCTPYKLALRP